MPRELENKYELWELVAKLPERQRQAVTLRAYGLTQEESGGVMGVSHSAVGRLIKRAVILLREEINVTICAT